MWKIPLCDLHFGPEETEAAARVVASGWLTMGERTQAFERALGEARPVAVQLEGLRDRLDGRSAPSDRLERFR